jgi:uncharacterized membrane protein YGL010W
MSILALGWLYQFVGLIFCVIARPDRLTDQLINALFVFPLLLEVF